MLTSTAVILLSGLALGWVFRKIKLPSIIGMIVAGILISPNLLNLVDDSMLKISSDIRQFALVIILTRAGLTLDISDLRKIGRPAVLMCFVPACIEIMGTIVFAPLFFGISVWEAALLGSVIAAVSPAVVVPRMIQLIEDQVGTHKGVPQLILAGASVDDVFVIVVFTALCTLLSTGTGSVMSVIQVPVSIVGGLGVGVLSGLFMHQILSRFHFTELVQFLLLLCCSFLLLNIEQIAAAVFPFSGLLAIMSMAMTIRYQDNNCAHLLKQKYNSAWSISEIFLFVLVGINVDLNYAFAAGPLAILLVVCVLLFRMAGVALSLLKTSFDAKEKLFCMLAYTPKATVQAAIGAIPLTMGLACGELIMTVSVISICLTAPFGAICIDSFSKKLLCKNEDIMMKVL